MLERTSKEKCLYHLALINCEEGYKPIINDVDLRNALVRTRTLENVLVGLYREIPTREELTTHNQRFESVFWRLERLGDFEVINFKEELFPINLREYSDIPLLYLLGDRNLLKRKTFAVVGNREKLNENELSYLNSFLTGKYFDEEEPILVTGLRRECETEATKSFLNRKRSVIGFLGNPLDYFWPKENKDLQKAIGKEHLLISPYPTCLGLLYGGEFPKGFFSQMTFNIVSLADEILVLNDEGSPSYDGESFRGSKIAGWVKDHCNKREKRFWTTPENPERYGWDWGDELEEDRSGLLKLREKNYF
jgi:DNA processing protein